MFGQLQRMFAPHEGAVNWDYTRDLARQVVAQTAGPLARRRRPDPSRRTSRDWPSTGSTASPTCRRRAARSPRGAAPSGSRRACRSGSNWSSRSPRASSPRWADALPAEAKAMAGPMLGMLNQFGSAMFSQQIGQAIGGLSQEVVSAPTSGSRSDRGRPAGDRAEQRRGLRRGPRESTSPTCCSTWCCASARTSGSTRTRPGCATTSSPRSRTTAAASRSTCRRSRRACAASTRATWRRCRRRLTGGLFDLEHSPAQQAALDPARDDPRADRGLGRRGRQPGDREGDAAGEARCARPSAAGAPPVDRPRRRSPPWSGWSCGRGGCATPPRCGVRCVRAEGAAARDAVWAHPDVLPTAADLDDPLAYAAAHQGGRRRRRRVRGVRRGARGVPRRELRRVRLRRLRGLRP